MRPRCVVRWRRPGAAASPLGGLVPFSANHTSCHLSKFSWWVADKAENPRGFALKFRQFLGTARSSKQKTTG